MFCFSMVLFIPQISHAQKACCAKGTSKSNCAKEASADVACCSTAGKKQTTSGCTPSNCRGAKTKYGEAKVISELRLNLIALKAKMEKHERLEFSQEAISVHDIIGDTDDQSLEIVTEQVALIQSEIMRLTDAELPDPELSTNKALKVKQLSDLIIAFDKVL